MSTRRTPTAYARSSTATPTATSWDSAARRSTPVHRPEGGSRWDGQAASRSSEIGGDPADVELCDQLGVVEHVDRRRAVADDRERQHRERLLAVERDRAGGAVDQRGTNVRRKPPGADCPVRNPR